MLPGSKLLFRLSPRSLFWAMWAIALGGVSIVLAVFYLQSVAYQKEGVRRDVLHLAQSLAHLVDMERHEALVSPDQMGSPLHRRTLEPLVRFHLKIPEIHYVYTMRVIDGKEYFVLDTASDERIKKMRGDVEESVIMEEYEMPESIPAALPAMLRGEAYVYDLPYADEYGRFISAQAPLHDEAGNYVGYAGVDYDISDYRSKVRQIRVAGIAAWVVAFFVCLVIAKLTHRLRVESLAQLARRESLQQSMQEAKERAEAATLAKSEMLAMATHDLKNPLTAIKGRSETILLRHEAAKGEAAPVCREQDLRAIRSIHESATHMADLIENVLQAERLSQPGIAHPECPVNLSAECENLLVFHRILAEKKHLRLSSRIEAGIQVRGEGARLREACGNLVSNAIKYSSPGSAVKVVLETSASGDTVEFSVTDHGPGIRPEERHRLFGRFERLSAEPTGGETSTGLGLYIVKSIVEAHHGTVECESTPGHGARFTIRLPREAPPTP